MIGKLPLIIAFNVAVGWNSMVSSVDEATFLGGTPCNVDSQCYSGVCYTDFKTAGFCAPDGPVNGTMAGGSACWSNGQCFSNYCFNHTCAPDSRVKGKVAAGGMCWSSSLCYSGYCHEGRCRADGPVRPDAAGGLLAAGAQCQVHEQCYSGYCHGFRCGPDGSRKNVTPGGGACSHNEQCSSNVCYSDRCSPESHSYWWRGKVANGGRCRRDEDCPRYSFCEDDICSPVAREKPAEGEITFDHDEYEDEENQPYYGETEDSRPVKMKPGERCTKDDHCFYSLPCVFNRCSPSSPANKSLIADGGRCTTDMQCASGQCHGEVCSVSYAPISATGWVAAGSYCREDRHCYSFLCVQGKCSSDSYANDAATRSPYGSELHANRVAAGGICHINSHCYSGLCITGSICSADGPQMRTVAAGGYCSMNTDCASGYCYYGRCVAGGDTPGLVSPGGMCRTSDMCAPGSMCVDSFCKRPKDGMRRQIVRAGSGRLRGPCWHTAQCTIGGRCLARRCRAPPHWTDAAVRPRGALVLTWLISLWCAALCSNR